MCHLAHELTAAVLQREDVRCPGALCTHRAESLRERATTAIFLPRVFGDVIAPAFQRVGVRARAQDRPRRLDEQRARIRIALFGNPAQASLRRASRRRLAWN